jgi:hypothetical protein
MIVLREAEGNSLRRLSASPLSIYSTLLDFFRIRPRSRKGRIIDGLN